MWEVKITDQFGRPIDLGDLVEITLVACEQPVTVPPGVTNVTMISTIPPRECLDGFVKCYESEQCIWEPYICDGEWDCQDHTDESRDCQPPPPPSPSNHR